MVRSVCVALVVCCLIVSGHTKTLQDNESRDRPVNEPTGSKDTQGPSERKSLITRRGRNAAGNEKWAYVTVRPRAHQFYWLYHTYHADGYLKRPWIIWLQGGPGASSTGYGNFELIGPLDLNLKERNTTWVNQASVLFIDNPVGAGYSYIDNLGEYATNVDEVTLDLVSCLVEFLVDNPEFKTLPLYVFGQSYGGKMGSHFARRVYQLMDAGKLEVNIVGVAMGNSWISPVDSTITWGPLLYQMSLCDAQGYDAIMAAATLTQTAVEEERWEAATNLWAFTEYVVWEQTNFVDFYNILKFEVMEARSGRGMVHPSGKKVHRSRSSRKATDPLDELMNGDIRIKLGIIPDDVIWGSQYDAVFEAHTADFMKPVVDVVSDILENTTLQVIVYQGQLDLICDTAGAMDWVQKITWEHIPSFNSAARYAFTHPETLQTELFVKAYITFKFYWLLGAGHAVAADNPEGAYRMLDRILNNSDV